MGPGSLPAGAGNVRKSERGCSRSGHRIAAGVVGLLLLAPVAHAQSLLGSGWIVGDVAELQALDKITARISTIEAPIGKAVRFGPLAIVARACDKKPPTEPPESAAYLEIVETKPGDDPVKLFAGWMFASSPALHALEHPVYDVWVVDCRSASTEGQSSSPK